MRKIEQAIIEAINARRRVYLSPIDSVDFPPDTTIQARVFYHFTPIATIYTDRVIITSGGHRTVTTKSRLNAILREYTDCTIAQIDYTWYVSDSAGYQDAFEDGMSVPRIK